MEVTFSRMYENLPSLDALYRFLVDRGLALVAFYDFSMRDGLAGWTDCLFANPEFG